MNLNSYKIKQEITLVTEIMHRNVLQDLFNLGICEHCCESEDWLGLHLVRLKNKHFRCVLLTLLVPYCCFWLCVKLLGKPIPIQPCVCIQYDFLIQHKSFCLNMGSGFPFSVDESALYNKRTVTKTSFSRQCSSDPFKLETLAFRFLKD